GFRGGMRLATRFSPGLGMARKRIEIAPAAIGSHIQHVPPFEGKDTPGDVLLLAREIMESAGHNRRRISLVCIVDPDVAVACTGIASAEAVRHGVLLAFA